MRFDIWTAAFLWQSIALFAQQSTGERAELVSDRPGFTEPTNLLRKGDVQIESGFYAEKQKNGTWSVVEPGLLFRFGVHSRFELRLKSDGVQVNRTPGIGLVAGWADAGVSAKWMLVEEGKGSPVTLTLLPEIFIPSGSAAVSSGGTDAGLRVAFARQLRAGISLGGNGYWRGLSPGSALRGRGRSHLHEYSVTVGFPVKGKWSSFVEYYASHLSGKDYRPAQSLIDGGLVYAVSENLQVDVSCGLPGPRWRHDPQQPGYFFAFGFTVRHPRGMRW